MPSLLSLEFNPFPKMARLSRECIITEKIDGTNAQVLIAFHDHVDGPPPVATVLTEVGPCYLWAGSRTRWITPGKTTDNFGFARWVQDSAPELVKYLGDGRHFGEWYGKGIQRGYGMSCREFALFNTKTLPYDELIECSGLSCVPTLWEGDFDTEQVALEMERLRDRGSQVAPGFMNPEGIVVYHTAARIGFKKTFNDQHKEAA